MTDRERRQDVEPGLPPPLSSGMDLSETEFSPDLSAVQADDVLLDALGGSDPAVADGLGEPEFNALLLAWRRDIDSEPLADLIDADTAMSTVKTAALAQKYRQHRGSRRLLVPVAAAAAVLAIAFTGTGLAARDALPGDTLWGLTKVLYADHARSVEAAAAAKIDLERANIAIAGGRTEDARKALDDAQVALKQVSSEDSLAQLVEEHRQLTSQLQSPNSASAPMTPEPEPKPGQTSAQPAPSPTSSTAQLPAGTGGSTTPPASTTPPPVLTSTPVPSATSSATESSPRYEVSSAPGLRPGAASLRQASRTWRENDLSGHEVS